MSEYETLIAEHQTLQEQLAAAPDSVGLEKVQDFVQRTRLAGARIGDAEQREQLRAILRHWSVFVYGQTGEYPASQLVPYDDRYVALSRKQANFTQLIILAVGVVMGLAFLGFFFVQSRPIEAKVTPTPLASEALETLVAIVIPMTTKTAAPTATPTTTALPTSTPLRSLALSPTLSVPPSPTIVRTPQPPVSNSAIRFDNVDELRLLAKRSGNLGGVSALVFSPDGTRLASTGFGGPALWVLPDLTLLSRDIVIDQSSGQGAIAFSPDGRILATGGESGGITLWDARSGIELSRLFTANQSGTYSLAFSSSGEILASGGTDGSVVIWNVITGQPIVDPLVPAGANGANVPVAFDPSGRYLATGATDGSISLWGIPVPGIPMPGNKQAATPPPP